MSDIYNPPPGAREWLASCLVAATERAGSSKDAESRAFWFVGFVEAQAHLTPEQQKAVDRWLFPHKYDAEGNRKP